MNSANFERDVVEVPTERFRELLHSQIATDLDAVGFAVIDDAFGADFGSALRAEIEGLYRKQKLYPNKTYYDGKLDSNGNFTYSMALEKPNVYELDLVEPETRVGIPHLDQFYTNHALVEIMNNCFKDEMSIDKLDVKVQYNAGAGGCFPMHWDTSAKVSRRQLTAILYLNPTWQKGDGGELVLYPFPYSPITIAPKMDRLVLFSSHQMLHRVLPSRAERVCLTLWFEGAPRTPLQVPATYYWLGEEPSLRVLLHPDLRKILSKIVWLSDWERSTKEGFGESAETSKVIERHQAELKTLSASFSEELIEFVKENLPIDWKTSREFRSHVSAELLRKQ